MNCSAPLAVTYDPNWLRVGEAFDDPLTDAETFSLILLMKLQNKISRIVYEVKGSIWVC